MNSLSLRMIPLVLVVCALCGRYATAQDTGVTGYWREPEGSIIHIDACGNSVCATLVAISASAPARVDGKNPDPNLRSRSLCGLLIGSGFRQTKANLAEGGNLYDPKSGKTYHGILTSHGNDLDLRGYIGLAIFGRSERWTRTSAVETCSD